MRMESAKPTVFISYAREDQMAAQRVYRDLTRFGIPCWLDTECLQPGEPWKDAISTAIGQCTFFLALLSENSVSKRGHVQKELREALDVQAACPPGDIFLIPLRLDGCVPGHQEIRGLNYVDLFPTWDSGIDRLRRFLGDGTAAGTVLLKRAKDHLALKDVTHLKAMALQLRHRHDIELFLRSRLSSLPNELRVELWARNAQQNVEDLSACLELHYVDGCGELDPKTLCHECGERGTIIHGVIDIGGKSPTDYNDNYVSWCTNCLWAWYYFYIDYLGKGTGTFDYATNTFENFN